MHRPFLCCGVKFFPCSIQVESNPVLNIGLPGVSFAGINSKVCAVGVAVGVVVAGVAAGVAVVAV